MTLMESRYLEEVRYRSCCGGATFGVPIDSCSVIIEVVGGEVSNMNRAREDVIMGNISSQF